MASSTNFSTASDKFTKWVILSTTIAVVALVIAYAAIREARQARAEKEIVLSDADGRPRVRIAATANGGAIELLDERGRARIALRQTGDASSISMRRKEAEDEEAAEPEDYGIQLLVDESKFLNTFTMRDPRTHTVVGLSGTYGGSLDLSGDAGKVTVSSSPLASGLYARFGSRTATLEVSESLARLTFLEKGSVSTIQLLQAPWSTALKLSPPGESKPAVQLSAHEHGFASLSLDRSPPTDGTPPVELWVSEQGGRVKVNDKQLGAAGAATR